MEVGAVDAMRPRPCSMAQHRIPGCRTRTKSFLLQLPRSPGPGLARPRPGGSKERPAATMASVSRLGSGREAPRATVGWIVTKVKQSSQVTCWPTGSGLSQPAHEVGMAGHRVGGSAMEEDDDLLAECYGADVPYGAGK